MDSEKDIFLKRLDCFTKTLSGKIEASGDWTVKGFIDEFKNIYAISSDTKVISKILEIHLFPYFIEFAKTNGYKLELASKQNWYPDMTFVLKRDPSIKFAVDFKTTYFNEKNSGYCRGFTLGSHGEYFINRKSTKNIQYPYSEYLGHFCLGIIYSKRIVDEDYEYKTYKINELSSIPSVVGDFIFFAQEKWKIASDKSGSGNTANIGSIKRIEDIINGNGVFALAGEKMFDEYWANFGKMQVPDNKGGYKKLSSFKEYLKYKGLSLELYNLSR